MDQSEGAGELVRVLEEPETQKKTNKVSVTENGAEAAVLIV
jgi:hypothetical protein